MTQTLWDQDMDGNADVDQLPHDMNDDFLVDPTMNLTSPDVKLQLIKTSFFEFLNKIYRRLSVETLL